MAKQSKESDKLIADQAKEIAALKKALASKEDQSAKSTQKQVDLAKQLTQLYAQAETAKANELELDNKIQRAMDAMVKAQARGNQKATDKAKQLIKEFETRKELNSLLKDEIKQNTELNKATQEHLKLLKKKQEFGEKYGEAFENSLGFMDDINSKIKSIPVVGDLLSSAIGLDGLKEKMVDKFKGGFDAGADAAEEATDSIGGAADAAEGVAENASGVGKGMKGSIPGVKMLGAAMSAGPLVVVTLIAGAIALIKEALEMDQEITEMARGLGVAKSQAQEIHHEIADIAQTTKVVGANTKELSAAYMELTAITGQSSVASKEMLETQVLLKKQYGMTGEEASAFQTMSVGMGKSAEQNLATVQQMVEGYNTMTGDSMNFKEITKDIGKVSKSTLASYKGDVKALAMAAIQAKKIGMTLEETQQTADKLLDIESSIEAETKASVLLGKSVNMNKARELALMGDTAGAAAEAVKQAGSYDDLLKMNVFQRKAIAEAAGMSVDQLMKAGELEKMSKALGGEKIKDMKDLTAEQIAQLKSQGDISEEKAKELTIQQQQVSANEKMAQITDKLKAMFIKLMDPILKMVEPFVQLVDEIMPLLELNFALAFYPIKMALGWVEALVKLFTGDLSGAADAFTNSFTQGLGDLSIFGGGGESGGGEKEEKMNDGVISGGAVVKSPKGTFKLADEDTIIAGTELGKPGKGGEVLDALKDMLSKVKGIKEEDLEDLEDRFDEVEDVFAELDFEDIAAFSAIGKDQLVNAGDALAAGLNSMTDIGKGIDLDDLEDSFDELEDVLDELDFGDLVSFGKLAKEDLSGVGKSLAAGINSLGTITDDVNLGDVEDVFEELDDALGELDIKDLVDFMKLSNEPLGNLGANLKLGIDSLVSNITPDMASKLEGIEDVFDQLEDVIAELDIEEIEDFMKLDFAPLASIGTNLQTGIAAMAGIKAADLSSLEDTFDVLEDAIDELDMDELKEFMELDLGNLASLASGGGGGGGGAAAANGGGSNAEMIGLLKQLVASVSQPVTIKIGNKAVEEIEKLGTMNRTYNTKMDKAGY